MLSTKIKKHIAQLSKTAFLAIELSKSQEKQLQLSQQWDSFFIALSLVLRLLYRWVSVGLAVVLRWYKGRH
jgi:hypothetical protein